ncbi:hypoxanthine phosphoribosyltransferase [Candidatus Peregrinibacteria bacterium]|nr:hypoxanthine phosphoribosyltransferase [Candidatus Peregrinibacteria bacterium]
MRHMETLFTREQIEKRIKELGEQISADYINREILAIGLLKGCTVFMSHLLLHIDADIEIDFMTISSYKHGTKSNEFKFVQDLDTNVNGKHILIVEDIIDTGKTMAFTQDLLKQRGAASVETVVFVDKKSRRTHEIAEPKYVGFNYDEEPFIVGFGFDLSGKYRNLPHVYKLSD